MSAKRVLAVNVRRAAAAAIRRRLRYDAPEAIIGVDQDGSAVVLHVNSGGNALAASHHLQRLGYQVDHIPYGFGPGEYGAKVRVTS